MVHKGIQRKTQDRLNQRSATIQKMIIMIIMIIINNNKLKKKIDISKQTLIETFGIFQIANVRSIISLFRLKLNFGEP